MMLAPALRVAMKNKKKPTTKNASSWLPVLRSINVQLVGYAGLHDVHAADDAADYGVYCF